MSQSNGDHRAVCFMPTFHENLTYAGLYPRLSSVVRYHLVSLSGRRYVRGLQYRAWQALKRRLIYPLVLRRLERKYSTLFAVDTSQIPFWSGSVVVDINDPAYDSSVIQALRLPQVKAIVVSTERAREAYRRSGVDRPIHVIPQLVMTHTDPEDARNVRGRFKRPGDVVVGYPAATLTLASDGPRRARGGLDDLDSLFAAVEGARAQEPTITLWLLGEPSASVEASARDKPWVKIFGHVPASRILSYVSNFDIGVYPRTGVLPFGSFSVKLAQYMACGLPVVSTPAEEAVDIDRAGCGILCSSVEDFNRALVDLARSPDMRVRLGTLGREYARSHLDHDRVVSRYEEVIRSC